MLTENSNVEIEPVHGHWEVFVDGKFVCSADSYNEAENEVNDI